VNSIDLENSTTTVFAVNYGSYVRGVGTAPAQFILLDAPANQITLGNAGNFISDLTTSVPFLFTGSVCGVNMSAYSEFSTCTDAHATPDSQVILELTPKTADDLDLKGYARKMFAIANTALVNDPALGAAVINAGVGVSDPTVGDKLYQGIYSEFAPDVTGSQRAIGIALTDQSSGPVGARQRALRMYAGQDGDATLWGQEFVERLNVSSTANATGYADTGFGFALGMDVGDPHDGRYGAALTFYSGDTNERPRTSRTNSEWYMLTGYSDWRSKGMFFDSQISAGYGSIDGKRTMIFSDPGATCGTQTDTFCRTAEGNRSSELLAGGFTTGFIVNEGGTVMIPQISLDGLTMRQEGYHESSSVKNITAGTDGFDLNVKPSYANSLRAFTGVDMRQDLRFDGFYFQPEARAGFRYDFIDGADKLKAEFACSTTSISAENCGDTGFSITGPDPARANVVVGGGFALTTGAWSLGVNYDYTRGFGGTDGTNQTGTLTLLGRI
jgi:outer membrane autotransporter protein